MKLATTTGDFTRYFPDTESRIRALYRAGFRHIDLSLYRDADPASVFMKEGWEREVSRLAEIAGELGMDFVQSHAPGGNPLERGPKRDLLLASTVRSLEICAMLGSRTPSCTSAGPTICSMRTRGPRKPISRAIWNLSEN